MKGNLQDALKSFTHCKEIDPSNPAVYYEMSMIHRMLGLNDLALEEARVCAASNPANEWYQLLLIECLHSLHRNNEALKVREKLVKNFPDHNDFKQDLAYDYAMAGQYNKAFTLYDELEKNVGVNEELSMNKLKLLKNLNRPDDAEKELKKLIASAPEEALYRTYLAEFYMDQKQNEKAKALYDTLLLMDPDNPSVHLALHDYYSMRGESELAFTHLKTAFLNPELDADVKTGILISYLEQSGDSPEFREKGRELTLALIRVHPQSPEANAIYAEYLLRDQKTEEAATYFYKAATLNTGNFKVWENLLLADIDLLRMDSLERHSAMAMELFPGQPIVYYYNGYANVQKKNYKKALIALNDGISVVSGNNNLLLKLCSLAGDAAYYNGDAPRAFAYYGEALKVDPDNTYVLNNYAYFLALRKEELQYAERLSKHSLDLKPEEKNYMDTYGWILYQQARYSEAEFWLSKAASTQPPNAAILEHYGDALFRNGKADKALEQWKGAKTAGSNSEELQKKIRCKCLND